MQKVNDFMFEYLTITKRAINIMTGNYSTLPTEYFDIL